MKLKNLLEQVTPMEIVNKWNELHGSDVEKILIEDLLDELLTKPIKEANGVITVEKGQSYYDPDKTIYNVTLYEDEEPYGISLMEWENTINTEVKLNDIDRVTFLTSVLYEMTWHGFDETLIKKRKEELHKMVEGVKSGEIETYTHKEFMEKLGE